MLELPDEPPVLGTLFARLRDSQGLLSQIVQIAQER